MGIKPDQALIERNERMASMFRQGLTLAIIGKEYGLTRERVRQILKKLGLAASDGGQHKKTALKRSVKASKVNAKYIASYGVDYAEYKKLRSIGAVKAFKDQRKNAKERGIEFRFTLADWWAIWRDSGKFEQRGRTKDGYVMSRISDAGCYEVGNVHIKTLAENSRDAVKVWKGRKKTLPRGVFENLPGYSKPFLAKVAGKSLGYFATPQEAVDARNSYIKENQIRITGLGSGRGWTYLKRSPGKPYLVQITGMKSVSFCSQQEAESYYATTTAKLKAERQAV